MDADLLSLVKSSKIFSSLDRKVCQDIATHLIQLELAPEEILFSQGDPSQDVYILQSGRLAALLTVASGESKIVSYVEPQEMVGELGTLSNEPRTLTIKAIKKAVIFCLPGTYFIGLCNQYPAVLFATLHPMLKRSQQIIRLFSSEKRRKHIAIVPANHAISLAKFSDQLTDQLAKMENVTLFSDFHEELNKPELNFKNLQAMIDKIDGIKKPRHTILYLLKSYDSVLAKICFKNAEVYYIAADSTTTPYLDNFIIKKLAYRKAHNKIEPELILLHPENTLHAHNVTPWLALSSFALHHHVRFGMKKDYSRLVRYFREKPIGLVLSGGGTRGWAHLGAIKAILDAKIPIDAIGGTSVGAIIAASYAMNLSYEDTYEKFYDLIEISRGSVSWRSLTWPAISLFNAKKFTVAQQHIFGSISIEELWLPYFCVSTNIATNSEAIHRNGLLWEKVRSSSSLPGIIPPTVINGEMHFDGGLLNNLPIDIMRQLLGKRAKIIAVELIGNYKDEKKYNFPPILTFFQALFSELGIGYCNYKFPHFIDTFFRALLVGSLRRANENSMATNLLISLNLTKFSMLNSTSKKAQRLIDIGYNTTMDQISKFKL